MIRTPNIEPVEEATSAVPSMPEPEPEPEPECIGEQRLRNEPTSVSKRHDDPEERILRTDNDGVFTIQEEEATKMAADLRGTLILKKHYYRKLLTASAVLLVVSWLGNLGLIGLAVALTQKSEPQSGDPTDVSGNGLAIKAEGDNAKSTLRQGGEDIERAVRPRRNLRGGGPEWVRLGALDKTKSEVEELWADYESAVPITGTFEIDGTQFTDTVKPGTASYTPNTTGENGTSGCNVYEDVQRTSNSGTYKIECCGTAPCDLYQEDDPARRKACFSLTSTVIEKTKGKMLMKDLTWGDEILAANGVYQPYVLSIHSSQTQPNEFVRIYSSSADEQEAPIELTENHFLFIKGKAEPIVASQVNVGDFLIGKDGHRKVTSISRVTHDGFATPLTRDATMLVDGVLASALAIADGDPAFLNFGVVHVHFHDFGSRLASFIHFGCSYMDSYLCEEEVDNFDGEGENSYNIIFAAGSTILLMPTFQRNLLLILIPTAGMVVATSYVLLKALTPIIVLAYFMVAVVKKNRLSGKVKFD